MKKNKFENKVINEGAEAKIIKIDNKKLKKLRIKKNYRIVEIDRFLRKQRNKREVKILKKLKENNFNVPEIYEEKNDKNLDEFYFIFEYIDGKTLMECLNKELLKEIIKIISNMHNLDIVHGDLTTLNMILSKDNKIYLIDFGLADFTTKIEDKAEDLYLFFNNIKNEHNNFYNLKDELIKIYEENSLNGKKIIERVLQIEKRGRNKNKI